jgi:hypothetical protein
MMRAIIGNSSTNSELTSVITLIEDQAAGRFVGFQSNTHTPSVHLDAVFNLYSAATGLRLNR